LENYVPEDEISLRELIEILLKGWKWLVIVPLICGIISYNISQYAIEPTYESQVILEIHASDNDTTMVTSVNSIDEALSAQPLTPNFSMDSYIQQITSPEIILETLSQLELSDTYTYERFKKKITTSQTKDSSLLTVIVTDTDPEAASKMVNTLSNVFMDHVSKKKEEQLDTSTELLTQQLEIEKQKLDDVLIEVKEFESQEENLDFMEQELSLNNTKLQNAKSDLSTLEDTYNKEKYTLEQDIQVSTKKIKEYESLLNKTDKTFNLKKDILDSTLGTNYAASQDISVDQQIGLSVESEEINPIYINILQQLSSQKMNLVNLEASMIKLNNMYKYNHKTLTNSINDLEVVINNARRNIADLSYQKSLLDDKLQITRHTYTAFNNKLESARVAKAANISETSVILMSKGVVPTQKIGPRSMLNTAIGIILSGILTIFTLFFRAYWKNTSTPQT
jgi:capsular polysaccharide biosynthesis protein